MCRQAGRAAIRAYTPPGLDHRYPVAHAVAVDINQRPDDAIERITVAGLAEVVVNVDYLEWWWPKRYGLPGG